jgi:hypothetical protein
MEILGAVGIGGLLVKILDIFWLQKVITTNESDKWKRDKKFSVYSRMASDLISQQGWGKENRPPELYALLGETLLLIENEALGRELDSFYKESLNSFRKSSGMRQTAEHYGDDGLVEEASSFHAAAHARLQQEASALVAGLKKDMLI